jgi:hypothetical protein
VPVKCRVKVLNLSGTFGGAETAIIRVEMPVALKAVT